MSKATSASMIALPPVRLCIGVTGHRDDNPAFAANRTRIEAALKQICDAVDRVTARSDFATGKTRLHSLLAHGADIMAVEMALAKNWDVVAPLPFGLDLNIAINAHPVTLDDYDGLVSGGGNADPEVTARAHHIRDLAKKVHVFALAEQDDRVAELMRNKLSDPADRRAAQNYSTVTSERAAVAARVMIDQCDVIIGIWDGVTIGSVGGTRHCIAAALELGVPVIWVNASAPENWYLLRTPEALVTVDSARNMAGIEDIDDLLMAALVPVMPDQTERATRFHSEKWHPYSRRRFHAYRRIEALFGDTATASRFGSLRQRYELPEMIAAGSGAALLASAHNLPGSDAVFTNLIETHILRRFAWADGLSTYLSDAYRGGMVANFLLSAFAIIGGITYLPIASAETKWPFALFEFVLLLTILIITATGTRKRWHGRWFETRRVAEYFRHAPIVLLLGVARSPGRWPRGKDTEWPEYYARHALRELGLPKIRVTAAYLRVALKDLLLNHAMRQSEYHRAKAKRLTAAHHNLDRMSAAFFLFAVISVACYLMLVALTEWGAVSVATELKLSKDFTFFGVFFPTLGGAFAGIRYFGDFERFAAISDVTAEKLEDISLRIETLLPAPEGALAFAHVAELAHAVDDIVVAEIENWQAVFGGKHITVPV
jgi:hypothetical protein